MHDIPNLYLVFIMNFKLDFLILYELFCSGLQSACTIYQSCITCTCLSLSFQDTRYQLFMLRPTQRASWIGFAMSYHLLGDFEVANSILDSFRTNQMKGPYDYEHSELLLYQNMVLAESGQYERALQHLHKFDSQILDKLAIKETSGEYYLKMKR